MTLPTIPEDCTGEEEEEVCKAYFLPHWELSGAIGGTSTWYDTKGGRDFDGIVESILRGFRRLLMTVDNEDEHAKAKVKLSKTIGEARAFCDKMLQHRDQLRDTFGDDVRICHLQAMIDCMQEREECKTFEDILAKAATECALVQEEIARDLRTGVDFDAVRAKKKAEVQAMIVSWMDAVSPDTSVSVSPPTRKSTTPCYQLASPVESFEIGSDIFDRDGRCSAPVSPTKKNALRAVAEKAVESCVNDMRVRQGAHGSCGYTRRVLLC
jgi:hypothetical protein